MDSQEPSAKRFFMWSSLSIGERARSNMTLLETRVCSEEQQKDTITHYYSFVSLIKCCSMLVHAQFGSTSNSDIPESRASSSLGTFVSILANSSRRIFVQGNCKNGTFQREKTQFVLVSRPSQTGFHILTTCLQSSGVSLSLSLMFWYSLCMWISSSSNSVWARHKVPGLKEPLPLLASAFKCSLPKL